MTDPLPSPTPRDHAGQQPVTGMPRWVKLLGIVALVVIVLLVVLLLAGGHGPGRHT